MATNLHLMLQKLKIILIVSLSLNLAGVFFGFKRLYYANYLYFNPPVGTAQQWDSYIKSKTDTGRIVFFSTSITNSFPLTEAFNNPKVQNFGYAGLKSDDLLKRLPIIVNKKPSKIFIETGINDIRRKLGIDGAFKNFVKMIELIQLKSPKTIIYAQSILPTDSDNYNIQIRFYNEKLLRYTHLKGVNYIDLYPHFLRANQLDKSLTRDGIHLNETGYYLWRTLIENNVN